VDTPISTERNVSTEFLQTSPPYYLFSNSTVQCLTTPPHRSRDRAAATASTTSRDQRSSPPTNITRTCFPRAMPGHGFAPCYATVPHCKTAPGKQKGHRAFAGRPGSVSFGLTMPPGCSPW